MEETVTEISTYKLISMNGRIFNNTEKKDLVLEAIAAETDIKILRRSLMLVKQLSPKVRTAIVTRMKELKQVIEVTEVL